MTLTKAGRSKRAKAAKILNPTEMFFYDNAGFSYKKDSETENEGHIRRAKELAEAETIVARFQAISGWRYEWEWDTDADLSWMDEEERSKEHEVMCCRLADHDNNTLASLCGIVDPSKDYARVIEAELAEEAMADYDSEIETLDAH